MKIYDTFIARAYFRHAINRASERYQIILTEYDLCLMADLILNGFAKLKLKQRKCSRAIYKLRYLSRNFVVVFDQNQLSIVTFLPHVALKNY